MQERRTETIQVIDTHAHYWEPPRPDRPYDTAELARVDVEDAVSAEQLLGVLDDAGVEKVIQVTRSIMGYDNRYSLEGAARHPDRVRVFGRFDPAAPDMARRLETWLDQPYMTGIRLMLCFPPQDQWLLDGTLEPFWAKAEELDIPVAVYAPYQARTLGDVARRYPGLRLLVDHLALRVHPVSDPVPPSPFLGWSDLLDLARVPNVFVKVSALPEATDERFPFPEAQQRLRQVYERFGPDRLLWGSNYPPTLRVCSYREAVDFIRTACDFLSPEDRAKILGGTAKRVLRLPW